MHGGVGVNVLANCQGWVDRFSDTLFTASIIAVYEFRANETDRENSKFVTQRLHDHGINVDGALGTGVNESFEFSTFALRRDYYIHRAGSLSAP